MSDIIQANGLYFFPPVYYEKSSGLTMIKPMSQFLFNGKKIFIDYEGYLATSTDDKDVSENILNSVFLSTTLLKYQVLRANKSELETLKIDLSSNEMKSFEATITSIRGHLHTDPKIRENYPQVIIKKNEFEIILQLAEKILISKFKTAILTFYDSYTLYNIGDYTGSFLMGWISIESYLSAEMKKYFQKMGVFRVPPRFVRKYTVRKLISPNLYRARTHRKEYCCSIQSNWHKREDINPRLLLLL